MSDSENKAISGSAQLSRRQFAQAIGAATILGSGMPQVMADQAVVGP